MVANGSLAEIDGGTLSNDLSLFQHLEMGLRKAPDGPAVICMHQSPEHLSEILKDRESSHRTEHIHGASPACLRMTYAELHDVAMRIAAGLTANGVTPGSVILMLMPNGAEFCILLWASIIMRMTITSLDPTTLIVSAFENLRTTLRTLRPSVVVVADITGTVAVDIAVHQLKLARPLGILASGGIRDGWTNLQGLVNVSPDAQDNTENSLETARNDDPERVHSILFTSGTSGEPKGCPLRVKGQTNFLQSWSWLIHQGNCGRVLQQAHNSRAIASTQVLQTWCAGGTVVMPSRGFVIDDTMDAIGNFGATFIVLSPTMVHTIAERLKYQPINLDSVKRIQVGGDAVTKGTLLKCAELFPNAQVFSHHGMSEGVAAFQWPFFDIPITQIPFLGETCPIGKVALGVKVRLWNRDEKRVSNRSELGEMHISGEGIIHHYLHGRSQTSFYKDQKGWWFNTGDVAIMDDSGLVYILGRATDMIKRDGVLVAPAVQESCIEKYTGAQTCVVSVPDLVMGLKAVAVLSDWGGRTEQETSNHVRTTLGSQFAVDNILTLEMIGLEKFPVNPTFKVIRDELQHAVVALIEKSSTAEDYLLSGKFVQHASGSEHDSLVSCEALPGK